MVYKRGHYQFIAEPASTTVVHKRGSINYTEAGSFCDEDSVSEGQSTINLVAVHVR